MRLHLAARGELDFQPSASTRPDKAEVKYQQVFILGDIGGQRAVFEESLRRIGLDPEQPHLPAGTALIQLGDVGRIPFGTLDTPGCIELAERLLAYNPRAYYQLFGNHDYAMVAADAPWAKHWVEVKPVLSAPIQRWWRTKRAYLALSVAQGGEPAALVTHAGLTAGQWRWLCKRAETQHMSVPSATDAAHRLNAYVGERPWFLAPGRLNTGVLSERADVLWADSEELLGSWLNVGEMPFSQLHGHASPFAWRTGQWVVPQAAREITSLLPAERWAVSTLRGLSRREETITALDWELGDEVRVAGYGIYRLEDVEITG